MQGAPQTALTPSGIRDGHPAALKGLIERRSAPVLQYCEAVCGAETAGLAAAEAFARFRAAVASADDPAALDPEPLLMSATRHAAATYAPAPRDAARRGRLARRAPDGTGICADVPALLAARADRMLDPGASHDLAVHLEQHPPCRAIEAAFDQAERAYREPVERPLPPGLEAALLTALAGAAPVVGAGADAPSEPASHPEGGEPPPAEPEHASATDSAPAAAPGGDPRDAGVAQPPARPGGLPRTRRHVHVPHPPGLHPHLPGGSQVYRLVLPAIATLLALIIILALAGVFGGPGPAPPTTGPATAAAVHGYEIVALARD